MPSSTQIRINTEIRMSCKRVQNIRHISAKSGQLKDQHIRNIIFAVLDIVQHPLEVLPAPLDVLAESLRQNTPGNNHPRMPILHSLSRWASKLYPSTCIEVTLLYKDSI